MTPRRRLILFEPRWHGWAQWQLEEHEPINQHSAWLRIIAKGWHRYDGPCRSFDAIEGASSD